MKLILIVLSLLSVVMLLFFCKSNKYTAQNLPKAQIRFGKGGGFVGKELSYTLLENGQLFDGEGQSLEATKRKLAKSCFKTIENLQLAKMDFKHPGNVYSFIEVPVGEGFHRVVWGGAGFAVDSSLSKLHQTLMEMVQPKPNNR